MNQGCKGWTYQEMSDQDQRGGGRGEIGRYDHGQRWPSSEPLLVISIVGA